VYRELEKHVAQLGAEPDEQTEELMVALRHRAATARPASSPRNTPLNRSSSDDPDEPNGDADTGFAARTKVVRRRQLWR
jgi:hypothetical protein